MHELYWIGRGLIGLNSCTMTSPLIVSSTCFFVLDEEIPHQLMAFSFLKYLLCGKMFEE